MATRGRLPGPREKFPGQAIWELNRDPTGFLSRVAREHGNVSTFPLGWHTMVLINHPDLIKDVLVTHNRHFIQGPSYQKIKRILPTGLLVSDGDEHLQRRRLMQPHFHRHQVLRFGSTVVEYALGQCARWQDGERIELLSAMRRLTLRMTAKTLFNTSIESEAEDFSTSVDELTEIFVPLVLLFSDVLLRVPNPIKRRYDTATRRLDEKILELIRKRQTEAPEEDLLSFLLAVMKDRHGKEQLSLSEVRDETLEIFTAGHGTIALGLTWALYLLARHPETEAEVLAELEHVLGGRPPSAADLEKLTFTRRVLAEALRLYPPVWAFDRQLAEDYDLGGYHFRAGVGVFISPWVTHRDPRFYPDPDRFDPCRWAPEEVARRPEFAYLPFGAGPHLCIGEPIAWLEGVLTLATLLPHWRIRPVSSDPPQLKPRTGLEPLGGIPVVLERRTRTSLTEVAHAHDRTSSDR